MVVFTLLIINKAGGLIYTRSVSPGLTRLSANDYLILAGTFHGIHAISRSLCPVPSSQLPPASAAASVFLSSSSAAPQAGQPATAVPQQQQTTTGPKRQPSATGIQSLETARFKLTVSQTPTGVKFLLFTSPDTAQIQAEALVKKCYEVYALYVMGNPFYSLEMPIRIERFEREVGRVLGRA